MGAESDASSAIKDMTFGSIAGMTAKVFEHPFDLVKVRLQSQPSDRPLAFTGPLDCFKQTYSKEGWRGLYRGLSAPIVGAACENATLFLVYNRCQELIRYMRPDPPALSDKAQGKKRELSTPELALAAAGAGAAASFVLTPIELIKCRMQVQMLAREGAFGATSSGVANASSPSLHLSPPKPASSQSLSSADSTASSSTIRSPALSTRPFSSSARSLTSLHAPPPGLPPPEGPLRLIASTIRTSGIRGLWLGQMGTLLRETGGSSAWFTAYETSSKFLIRRRQHASDLAGGTRRLVKSDLATYELMASGALAGMSYNIVLFPADSVKSAMQTAAELDPGAPRLSFPQMAGKIWRTRGIRGLYAGCGLTVARSAPSSAMIFLIYETLDARFGSWL